MRNKGEGWVYYEASIEVIVAQKLTYGNKYYLWVVTFRRNLIRCGVF